MNKKKSKDNSSQGSVLNYIQDTDLMLHTINSVHESISITDLNDRLIFVNKAFTKIYGYEPEEVIGKKTDFLRSDKNDPELLRTVHPSTLQGGWRGRIINKRKDGSEFTIELSTSIVKDDNGNPVAYVGIARDLTQLIETEEKLREAESKFRELFLELKDVVYENTIDGKFVDLNPAGFEFFGINSYDMLRKIDIVNDIYVDPQIREEFQKKLEKFGFVKDFELRIRKLNGKIATVLETSTAVKDRDGKIIGYSGILRDITEAKEREAKLQELVLQLESVNKQLKKSEEELKNQIITKDKFFSIIAHDLRSPFSALLSFSEFLRDDIDDLTRDEIVMFADKINEAAQNVFALLENLLQWSRIQSGKIHYQPHDFKLRERAERVIKLLSNNAENKDIFIINEIPDDAIVFADEDMISSVLQNLISNAIKFTRPGGKITLKAENEGKFFKVSVSDTGVGIKEEDLPKLFRLDVQHTTYGTNEEKGSGLGLIICKEMIEKNGGTITVQSRINEGTTFSFTLPATRPN